MGAHLYSRVGAVAAVLFLACSIASSQASKPVELLVRQPNGEPAVGARAAAFAASQQVLIRNGEFAPETRTKVLTAGETGGIVLPAPASPYRVAVVHESGCALLTQEQGAAAGDGIITLVPWGRIEGRLLIGDRPAPKAQVSFRRHPLFAEFENPFWIDNFVETDDEGRFIIEKVFPCEGLLSHQKILQRGRMYHQLELLSMPVEVPSGETLRTQLGGSGRPVVATAVVPEEARERFVHARLAPRGIEPKVPLPPGSENWTLEQKDNHRREWLESPEGIVARDVALRLSLRPKRSWTFQPDDQGRLRAEDVEPGEYVLLVSVMPSGLPLPGQRPLSAQRMIVVPPADPEHPREPHDLGEIQVR